MVGTPGKGATTEVRLPAVTDEQFRAAVEGRLFQSYVELLSTLYAGVRAGSAEARTDDVQKVLGRPPISLARFAKDHRATCGVIGARRSGLAKSLGAIVKTAPLGVPKGRPR